MELSAEFLQEKCRQAMPSLHCAVSCVDNLIVYRESQQSPFPFRITSPASIAKESIKEMGDEYFQWVCKGITDHQNVVSAKKQDESAFVELFNGCKSRLFVNGDIAGEDVCSAIYYVSFHRENILLVGDDVPSLKSMKAIRQINRIKVGGEIVLYRWGQFTSDIKDKYCLAQESQLLVAA